MKKIIFYTSSIIVKFVFFLLFSTFIITSESKEIQVLKNGTTFIYTYNSLDMLVKEEIILKSGRHKTTFYDMNEQPQYGVVYTGTGSFGLMYYEETAAPLFKFFDYGNGNKQLYVLSNDFEKICTVNFYTENNKRKIHIEGVNEAYNLAIIVQIFLWGMIVGLFLLRKIKYLL